MPKKPKTTDDTEKKAPESPEKPYRRWFSNSKRLVLIISGAVLLLGLAIGSYLYLNEDSQQVADQEPEIQSFEGNYDAYQNALSEGDPVAAVSYLEDALIYAPDEEKVGLTYEVGYRAFLAGKYDMAVTYLEEYKTLTDNEEANSRADFYIEQSIKQKTANESLDLQEYEKGGETPATSEVYEEL